LQIQGRKTAWIPNPRRRGIFDALNFKHRPYVRKTKVMTQM
jgi:hypothetical protein